MPCRPLVSSTRIHCLVKILRLSATIGRGPVRSGRGHDLFLHRGIMGCALIELANIRPRCCSYFHVYLAYMQRSFISARSIKLLISARQS